MPDKVTESVERLVVENDALEVAARELRLLVTNTCRGTIGSWEAIDPILKAVLVGAVGSFLLFLSGTELYGATFGVIEWLLIIPLLLGGLGLALQSWILTILCIPFVIVQAVLVVATASPNVDVVAECLASAVWCTGLVITACGFLIEYDGLFRSGARILAVGFGVDAMACIASVPPVARLLHVSFASNGVTWTNLCTLLGNVIVAFVLLRRAGQGMKSGGMWIIIGRSND